MAGDQAFDAMADICILAGDAVMTAGSDDLKAAMRLVLGVLGRELASRSIDPVAGAGNARATRVGRGAASRPARRTRFAPCA